MPTPRGPSSRRFLAVDWDHPVVQTSQAQPDGISAAPRLRRALPAAEAVARVAGEDRRPLLVLRECNACSGTEDALFRRREDNERTYLLSRWFHCVKLPPDVLEADHPFRNLFPGDSPSHLFVSLPDGSARHDLSGAQSRRELWNAMESVLKLSYTSSPVKPLRDLSRILDQLDGIDQELSDLKTRIELALAGGEKIRKIQKLRTKIRRLEDERRELLDRIPKVSQLQLRDPAAKPSDRAG